MAREEAEPGGGADRQTDRRPVLLREGGPCHQATQPPGSSGWQVQPLRSPRLCHPVGAPESGGRDGQGPLPTQPAPPVPPSSPVHPASHTQVPWRDGPALGLPTGPSASHTSRSSTHQRQLGGGGALAGWSDSSSNSHVLPSPSPGSGIPPMVVFPCERHE